MVVFLCVGTHIVGVDLCTRSTYIRYGPGHQGNSPCLQQRTYRRRIQENIRMNVSDVAKTWLCLLDCFTVFSCTIWGSARVAANLCLIRRSSNWGHVAQKYVPHVKAISPSKNSGSLQHSSSEGRTFWRHEYSYPSREGAVVLQQDRQVFLVSCDG